MKIKNIFTVAIFTLCMTLPNICTVSAADTEYVVTDNDRHIKDEAGLRKLSTMVNDWGIEFENDVIYLEDDITLDDTDFIPIGNGTYHFKGSIEGDGHTISNMHINNIDGVDYYGLFGVAENADISNIRLSNVQINISKAAQDTETNALCIGGLAGLCGNCNIMMCSVENGNITTNELEQDQASYTGGLIGMSLNSSVRFCRNNATIVSDTDYIGGIISAVNSDIYMDNIAYCCNTADIRGTGETSSAAGLAAANSGGDITYSYNIGRITSDNNNDVAGTVVSNYNTTSEVYGCVDMCSENISHSVNVGRFYITYANTKDKYDYVSYNLDGSLDEHLETIDMDNLSELEILDKVNTYNSVYLWAVNYGHPVLWWQAINGNDAIIRGDVSGDGYLAPKDISLILKHISNISVLTGDRLLCADYNDDGTVDLKDAILIMNNTRYYSYVTT